MRKSALLAFSLPLAATGTLAGHAAGYALTGGSRYAVHGYLAFAPQFLAVCVAVLLAAFALRAGGRLQGRPSPWVFAILPPVAFLVQEIAERVLAGLPAHALLERAVYAGLAAQAPIALLAYLAARALVRVADETAARSPLDRAARLLAEAQAIELEDRDMCAAIGRHGAALLPDTGGVLTHCNAGGLATAGYGTALGVIRAAH